jgi:flagellar protein FlbD
MNTLREVGGEHDLFTDPRVVPISTGNDDPARSDRSPIESKRSRDGQMITVTRLNGPAFALNPDLIERIEATPDTVIHLVGGTNYVVVETVDEIVARVRESRAAVIALSHLIDQRSAGSPNLRVVPSGEPEI